MEGGKVEQTPYAPPTVMAQPTTVVNIGAPEGIYPIPQDVRDWDSHLCGCFEDIGGCCYAMCCPYCFKLSLAGRAGEDACAVICCCDYIFERAVRTKIRTKYGIKGSIMRDILTMCFCEFCAVTQHYRELSHMG